MLKRQQFECLVDFPQLKWFLPAPVRRVRDVRLDATCPMAGALTYDASLSISIIPQPACSELKRDPLEVTKSPP